LNFDFLLASLPSETSEKKQMAHYVLSVGVDVGVV